MCQRHFVRGSYLLLSFKRMLIDDLRDATNDSWNMWYTLSWCVKKKLASHSATVPFLFPPTQATSAPGVSNTTSKTSISSSFGKNNDRFIECEYHVQEITYCRVTHPLLILYFWLLSRRCRVCIIPYLTYMFCTYANRSSHIVQPLKLQGSLPKLLLIPPRSLDGSQNWYSKIDGWLIVLLPRKKEISNVTRKARQAEGQKFKIRVVCVTREWFVFHPRINVTYCGARAVAY